MVDREQAMVNGIGSKTSVQGWSCREKVLAVLLGIGHFIRTFHNIIMAVAVRFAFFITGIALVLSLLIKKSEVKGTSEIELAKTMWPIIIPHVFIILETFYVLCRKCGQDYHWFCVSVFLYLLSSVPSIVILQNYDSRSIVLVRIDNTTAMAKINTPYEKGLSDEELMEKMQDSIDILRQSAISATPPVTPPPPPLSPPSPPPSSFDGEQPEHVSLRNISPSNPSHHNDDQMQPPKSNDHEFQQLEEQLNSLLELTAELSKTSTVAQYLDSETSRYVQMMLIVLLFGRWLLPRGTITREQLSALLISYLSMCADMLDFISLLAEEHVYKDYMYRKVIQVIWIVSLLQFTIVKSNVGGPRQRRDWVESMNEQGHLVDVRPSDDEEAFVRRVMMNKFTETDLWGVLFTMMLQDLPFLIVRLFVIFRFVLSNNDTIIFFLVKNIVLVMMDTYRLLVIVLSPGEDQEQESLEKLVPDFSHEVKIVRHQIGDENKPSENTIGEDQCPSSSTA